MEGPANTLSYFVAGYVVIFVVIIGYLVSLIVRWRNLTEDVKVLSELEEKDGAQVQPGPVSDPLPR